jgi:ADP-ribose pyrophosphatase
MTRGCAQAAVAFGMRRLKVTVFFEGLEGEDLPRFQLDAPEEVYACSVFRVRRRLAHSDSGEHVSPMYTLKCANWVNVVPITARGELVLVEQHRFGSDTVTLETPGGAVDPGEKDTTLAALRELQEETGLTSGRLLALSGFLPNPALQDNRIQYFIAFDCQPLDRPSAHVDPFERIRLHYVDFREALEMVRTGRIQHALAALAILLAEPYVSTRFTK